jgi:hypothetical protein
MLLPAHFCLPLPGCNTRDHPNPARKGVGERPNVMAHQICLHASQFAQPAGRPPPLKPGKAGLLSLDIG